MNPKNKLIIHNHTDMNDIDILNYIMTLVKLGKISKTSEGEQYCFAVAFKDGVTVYCRRRNNTYTFEVIQEL